MVGARLGTGLPTVRAAVAMLTRVPVRSSVGRSGAAAFALVGGTLGAVAAVPALALADRAPLLAATAAISVLAVGSGGLHLDGLADTIDALAAAPDDTERARHDPAVGALGAAGTSLVLLAECAALVALSWASLAPALVVCGAASRSVPVLAAPFVSHADSGLGSWWGRSVRRVDGLICGGCLLGLAVLVGSIHLVAIASSLVIGLAAVAALGRRFGVVSGDSYGAGAELAFLAGLIAEVLVR
ncbi:MAG: adenosylcobinamide-GDP ribazoletransferase [Candidatus Limnocylindrales bacterium]